MKTVPVSRLSIIIYTLAAIYSMIAGTIRLLWGYLAGTYRRSDLVSVPWLRWMSNNKQ
jgi:hypothetical protein